MPTIFVLLLFQLAICGVFAFGGRARNTDGGFDANVGDSVDGGEKSSRTLEDSNNPFSIVDPPDITGETRPCSPTHECMHNSTCEYELLNGDPSCDCSTATSDDGNDALFAGKYCEYEATSYCDKPNDLGERHFCTNGGGCFSLDSSAGCLCPDGYSGKHCEHFNYLDYIDNDEEEVVLAEDNDVLAGDYYHYEEEEQQEEQDENPVVDRDDEESVEIEYSGTPPPSHVPSSINPIHSEYQALAKFYETTSGDSWNRNDYWLSDIGICEWFGVGCNYDNSVSLLTLPSNSLTGALDLNTLRLLPNLTSLVLSDNRLFGRVDDNIGMLQKLKHLDLSQNLLHGLIPSALSDLSSLEELKLHDNRLTAFLLNDGYQNLRIIDLSNNYIQGTVQFDVARLHQLEVVRLSGNRLSGHFEKNYSQLKNLTHFDISRNAITGILPPWNGNPLLRVLNVSDNYLAGTIPSELMASSFRHSSSSNRTIFRIDLSLNNFESFLPDFEVERLEINVAGNMLKGIDDNTCKRLLWNGGTVSRFGCDGVACAIGTANDQGRQTSAISPCDKCESALYLGTIGCEYQDQTIRPTNGPSTVHFDSDCILECFNGGVCKKDLYGSERESCLCLPGFMGFQCESVPTFSPSPSRPPQSLTDNACGLVCYNGGFCERGYSGDRREYCVCPSDYMGSQCEYNFQPTPRPTFYPTTPPPSIPPTGFPTLPPINECPDCNNAGDCVMYANGKTGCRCQPKMTGINCEIPTDTVVSYGDGDERNDLVLFYYATSGPNWINDTNWLSPNVDKCSWHGIECDDDDNVAGIALSQNDLLGGGNNIWYSLKGLLHLKHIDFSENMLSGSLPPFLSELKLLDLSHNYLSGSLSEDVVSSEHLVYLDLSFNRISSFLHSWSFLPRYSLRHLDLSFNKLTSSIPVEIGNMVNLEVLNLSGNAFTFEFQETYYRNLRNLTHLDLSNNALEGELPSFDGDFYPILDLVNVSHNDMKGEIPSNLFANSTAPDVTLDISHNSFGPVFFDLDIVWLNINAAGNRFLRLDRNACSRAEWNGGDVEKLGCDSIMCPRQTYNAIGRQTSIDNPCLPCDTAEFYGATMCETLRPSPRPSSLNFSEEYNALERFFKSANGNSWNRNDLWLSFATMDGDGDSGRASVCEWYGISCNTESKVTQIVLPFNRLSGFLDPKALSLLPHLTKLDLSGNNFTGELDFFAEKLQVLNLSDNEFKGSIPRLLSRIPSLEELVLSGNEFISFDATNGYDNLRVLDLSDNLLIGNCNFLERLEHLEVVDLSGNNLSGSLGSYSLLVNLTKFDVSSNMIMGSLYDSIDVEQLEIDVTGNILREIDEGACMRSAWNNYSVANYGCDGIGCAIGTANDQGRQTSYSNPCLPCPEAIYIGTIGCNDEKIQPSQAPVSYPQLIPQQISLETLYWQTNGERWNNNRNWLSSVNICQWYGVECNSNMDVSKLTLASNSLVGEIEWEYLDALDRLTHLDLANNALKGFFLERTFLPELQILNLSDNFFSGTLPEEFPISKLEVLSLANNRMSGYIPDGFHSFPSLEVLDLSNNEFTGTLPFCPGFSENSRLRTLNVSHNNLEGEIRSDILHISDDPQYVDLSSNLFSGEVPSFYSEHLTLYAADNQLEKIDECPGSVYTGWDGCLDQSSPSPTGQGSVCPSDHKCKNGAKCVPGEAMGYTCDCPPVDATWFEIFAGPFCEFKATDFCADLYHVASYAFCVNDGKCLEVDIAPGSPHPGCSCPDGFHGDHCEVVNVGSTYSPSSATTLELTSRPSSSPVILPKTFSLYQIPPFVMVVLKNEDIDLSLSSLEVIELIVENFLLDEFTSSLGGIPDSMYITTLRLTVVDPDSFASSVTPSVTVQQMRGLVFTKIDGIIGIRDGTFNESNDVEVFMKAAMGAAFQAKDALVERIQQSQNAQVRSVFDVDLTEDLELCPNNLRCLHGSECLELGEGEFGCNCTTASNDMFGVFVGLQCGFSATQFCSDDVRVRSYSFCTNGGDCAKSNVTVNEPHPGCWCPEPFEGSQCELKKDIAASEKLPLIEDSSSGSVIGTDGYIFFLSLVLGLSRLF